MTPCIYVLDKNNISFIILSSYLFKFGKLIQHFTKDGSALISHKIVFFGTNDQLLFQTIVI